MEYIKFAHRQVIATEGSELRKEKGNKMIHKIPKWETEEFTPEDRKYEYSSYAIDVQEKEKKIIQYLYF